MLTVLRVSGQEVAQLDKNTLDKLSEKRYGNSVRALKLHLQAAFGVSIYRLKLIHEDTPLDDACSLQSFTGVNLVSTVVPFHDPTLEEKRNFLKAAQEGRLSDLETSLQLPIDPNVVLPEPPDSWFDASTALDVSAREEHLEAVELLLEAGADPGRADTGMFLACLNGNVEVVNLLIQGHADVNPARPLLNAAIRSGKEPLIKLLIEAKADPLVEVGTDFDNELPLQMAADKGLLGIVRLLIEARAEVDAVGNARVQDYRSGKTALHLACANADVDIVRFLIECNANVNAEDPQGQTPLCKGIIQHHEERNKDLVAWDSRVEAHERIVQLLLHAGADRQKAALAIGNHFIGEFLSVCKQRQEGGDSFG